MSIQQPTLAELRPGVREFKSEKTKNMILTANGKFVREEISFELIPTAGAGKLRKEDWTRLMEEAIAREGRTALLDAIIAYVSVRCAWLRTAKRQQEYALECLACGAYKKWKDFKDPETVELADYF